MDFRAIERELEATKKGLSTITQLSLETENATDDLIGKMTRLSGISSKGGIIRSIVTRGLVAFPTGYRIAQQASSALLIFRYLDQNRKERLKEEKEFNEIIGRRETILRKVQQLDKENLSFQEREALLTDASVKNKIKLLGVEGSIRQARQDLMKSSEKVRRTGRLAMRGQAARFMQNPDGETRSFSDFGIKKGTAEESLDIVQAKMQEKEILSFNDRIKGMGWEIDKALLGASKLKGEIEGNDRMMKSVNNLQKEIEKLEKVKRSDVGTGEYVAIMNDMKRITKMLDEGDLLKLTGGGSLDSLRQQAVALKLSTDQMNELEGLFSQMMGMQDDAERERTKKIGQLTAEKKGKERSLMGSETLRDKRKERDLALSIIERLETQQKALTDEQVFLIKELQETVKGINEEFGTEGKPVIKMNEGYRGEHNYGPPISEKMMTERLKKDAEQGGDLITGVSQLGFFEKLKLKAGKRRDKAGKNLFRLVALINKKFSATYFKLMLRVAGMALSVFGFFIGSMFMIAGLVYLLHVSGFFTNTLKFFDKFQKVIPVAEIFLEGVFDFFGGLFDIVSGLFGILIALFTGDSEGLMDSLKKIGEGILFKLLPGIGKLFLSIGMTLVGLVISSIAGIIGDVMGSASSVGGKIGGFVGMAGGTIMGAKTGAALGSMFGPAGTIIGGLAGAALGSQAGGHLGVMLGDGVAKMFSGDDATGIAGMFADGGTTSRTGTYLVGEKGPELVSLPGNTRVYNNTDTSRMMSPTININVTGRVGATETELNDIARKIGQKINTQMNRYNSSGLRG